MSPVPDGSYCLSLNAVIGSVFRYSNNVLAGIVRLTRSGSLNPRGAV
jgi:hypothetical protein